jgi:DNA-directed RNA polymerase subunit RPC12/RpoP
MNRAELRPAFIYTCDNCGKDNIAPMVIMEQPIDQFSSTNIFAAMTKSSANCTYCGELNELFPFNYGNSEVAE